ncbi:MAG: methyltransferase domain-containing protein [bacterium]
MADKHHYDFNLNLEHSSNAHRIEMDLIGQNAHLLDVGCHTGIMGEALRLQKQAMVIGIDTDVEALAVARTRLQAALHVNVESEYWVEELLQEGYRNFDVILFGDVLEHTQHPERILDEARKLLKPEGLVIVSIPNVAHWRIRFGLLFGRFVYTDSGILDKTHLRFFTHKSAVDLLKNSGYVLNSFDVAGYALPHWLLRLFPGLLAIQFVMSASRK